MAVSESLLRRLRAIAGDASVLTTPDALVPYSRDETPGLDPVMPAAVVRPTSAVHVPALLKACADAGCPVVPRGAGTGKAGGARPSGGDVVLSLEKLDRIVSIDKENLIARVEPGVILADFHAAVEAEGLFYPPDPASLRSCSLGGNVATNAGGPRALKYGVTRNYVSGLNAVLVDGTAVQTGVATAKGVAGYDVTGTFVGSEGTLGVFTELTLRLLPLPRGVQTALCVFDTPAAAARCVSAMFAAGVVPRTLEYMDRGSIDALRRLDTPYTFDASAEAALLVETDGISEEVAFAELERAMAVVQTTGATDVLLADDAKKRRAVWDTRRMLSSATRKWRGKKLSEDIVVPRTEVPAFVAAFDALGKKHGLSTCAFGHAGDGNLHAQICYTTDDELPAVHAVLSQLFELTLAHGGTITGEHGIGIAKRDVLPLEQSPALLALQRRIKTAFDPRGLLNPGKVIPPA